MKRIGLVALMIAGMICMTQYVHAYSFVNSIVTAEVAADGNMTYLSATGSSADLIKTMSASISYSLTSGGAKVTKQVGGDFTQMWVTPTPDATPEGLGDMSKVIALYRLSPRGAGDTLDVKVSTKLDDGVAYLAQRYWVEYDENGGADLFDVNLMITMVSETSPVSLWTGTAPLVGPVASDWGSTSNWVSPIDTAHLGGLRLQGYVPGIPDGAHSYPPDTITMDWNLGNLGNTPPPATVGALELRTDVVPEPCTIALMGAGLFGLFGVRRRRA